MPCHWLGRAHLQWQPQRRQSALVVPHCGPPGSAGWEEPARPTAGRLAPAAACGSVAVGAGLGAPGWPPAPRGWPGSDGCFCSGGKRHQ